MFELALGSLGVHFGHHFGRLSAPWDSFWRPRGSQSAPKVAKNKEKVQSCIAIGAQTSPKDVRDTPGPTKDIPEATTGVGKS